MSLLISECTTFRIIKTKWITSEYHSREQGQPPKRHCTQRCLLRGLGVRYRLDGKSKWKSGLVGFYEGGMSYKTNRYRQGLSGKRPGWVYVDEEGQKAQEAGYRGYLKNEDLADRIRGANQTENYSGYNDSPSYDSSPTPPTCLTWGDRMWLLFISAILFYLAFQVSYYLALHVRRDFGAAAFYPAGFDWAMFVFCLLLIPGGILFWPGFIFFCIGLSLERKDP